VIDIESKPNKKLNKLFKKVRPGILPADLHKAMSTSPDFCEIVCIGIKQIGGQTRVLDSIEQLGTPEWNRVLTQMPFITYNGKVFDLPVLIKAGVRAGVKLPYARLSKACKKWGYGDRHLDLMEKLSFGGRWQSLDTMLQIYCGIEKETKGNDFFMKATDKELKQHCAEDLELTTKLYSKFKDVFV